MDTGELHHYYRRMCQGHMESWVARPTRPVATIAKTVATLARKKGVSSAELAELLDGVRDLSVQTFGPERVERFDELTRALRSLQAL